LSIKKPKKNKKNKQQLTKDRSPQQAALETVASKLVSDCTFHMAANGPSPLWEESGAFRLAVGAPFAGAKTVVWWRERQFVTALLCERHEQVSERAFVPCKVTITCVIVLAGAGHGNTAGDWSRVEKLLSNCPRSPNRCLTGGQRKMLSNSHRLA
jgi:hypothetical protein